MKEVVYWDLRTLRDNREGLHRAPEDVIADVRLNPEGLTSLIVGGVLTQYSLDTNQEH
jgi:hypothetical protein